MSNEKQVWLHKRHKEIKSRINELLLSIVQCKIELEEYISHNKVMGKMLSSCELKGYRKELKELEKEIRIVKQLIKETK